MEKLTIRTGRVMIRMSGGIVHMPMTVRKAEKLLNSIGFFEVKGGKGSHRKFEKAGERPITLPVHSKELSRVVESSVKKALKKAEGE